MNDTAFKEWLVEHTQEGDLSSDGYARVVNLVKYGLDYRKCGLSPMQIAFALFYVDTGFNAKQAALRAGYDEKASENASMWVGGNPKYRNERLTHFISELVATFGASPKETIALVTDIARSDVLSVGLDYVKDKHGNEDVYNPVINFKRLEQMGKTHLIKSLRWQNGKIVHIEFQDSLKALELLMRSHGQLLNKVEITNIQEAAQSAGISKSELDDLLKVATENLKYQMKVRRLSDSLDDDDTQAESGMIH